MKKAKKWDRSLGTSKAEQGFATPSNPPQGWKLKALSKRQRGLRKEIKSKFSHLFAKFMNQF